MKVQSRILSEAEQVRVHRESLSILSKVGVRIHSRKALELLAKHGANVDRETKIARIPKELIVQTLATTLKAFVLGSRNPAYNYPLPSPVSRYGMDGTAAFTIDFDSGERRYGTRKDNENAFRIFQQMDMAVMAWPPVCAEDMPAHSRPLHEFFTMIKYCSKHGQHELHRTEQAQYLMEGLIVVMGSKAEVKARHAHSVIYCPVAPLTHDGAMLDAYLELGEIDLPVLIMPMPVTGTTGPASLFSNVCLANAETLSSIVIFQLAHPGRPLIYSSATGTVDFRSGNFLGGMPEMGLMSGALTEMGRFYDLPATSAGCTSDAKQPGAEAVLEKVITTIPPVLTGSDIIIGLGEIESDQLLILEQIIVDNEIAHFCERIFQGVDSNKEKTLTDDVIKLGPGGNFLTMKSTRTAARSSEFYMPNLIDRHSRETWLELGKPSMYSLAREKVQEILNGPVVDPLPEGVIHQLDDILTAADKEIKE